MAESGATPLVRTRIGLSTLIIPDEPMLEMAAIEPLSQAIEACIASREIFVVLDFVNVTLISSLGLETLLDAQTRLTRAGGSLSISNANTVLQDVLRITRMDRLVHLLDVGDGKDGSFAARQPGGTRLGEQLVARGLVTGEQVNEAIAEQNSSGERLGQILVAKGWLNEREMLEVLSIQFDVPAVRLRTGIYDPLVVVSLEPDLARRLRVMPLFRTRDTLYLASPDPQAIPSFDTVTDLTGARVEPVLVTQEDLNKNLSEALSGGSELSEYIGELDFQEDFELVEQSKNDDYTSIDEMAAGSPVINLINGLIQRAVRDGASDIHIEPSRKQCRIRMRIDGMLYQVMNPPMDLHPALVSRLKVMANLDIAERRLPQDGRIQVYTAGRTIDLRFSSLPGIYGEKIVLRVLDRQQSVIDVDQLGLAESNLEVFKRLLGRSYGLLLVTGPTGSGKTTTLYSALSYLNSVEKSIVTIEDPVEYQIDVINQNQVKEDIGLSFARVLKHVLRQDPDIVMVGEIREQETAEIAVQAALTGHLVLSTLHTNDSAGAITRMLDMGVEPYLLSSALIGVVAQRLIRTVCPHCKSTYMAPPGSLAPFGISREDVTLVRGRGCPNCYDSGYKGRAAIHEILEVNEHTQRLMIDNPTRERLAAHTLERGIETLLDAGVARAIAQDTTIEEVTRVVNA